MSISTRPMSNLPDPPSMGVSFRTLILSLIVSQAVNVCATVVIVLAMVYFRAPASDGGGDVLVQHATVSPRGKWTDVVYYPTAYGLPPNLKFTCATRQYDIAKQDEKGFTWKAVPKLDEFKDEKRSEAEGRFARDIGILSAVGALKPNLQYEDFTWEAKGVRPGKDTIFPQEGTFNTIAGKEGQVNFPLAYDLAPNVELSGPAPVSAMVIVVESRPTGFKWLNAGKDEKLHSGTLTWKAKGVRATDAPPPK